MEKVKYGISADGGYVIENYNLAKPFASFLPAIAGLNGKPMWLYYVNRGQCVSTFGINHKDNAIMEFEPANKAYRQTSSLGFRTFLRVKDPKNGREILYEPFQDVSHNQAFPNVTQKMIISSHDLRLEEENRTLGLKICVMYCTMPGEFFGALIRRVEITNLTGNNLKIGILDGMPAILPYYFENSDLKEMSNLRQAWMRVEHADRIPFYRVPALPYDTPETVLIEGGNFFLPFRAAGGKTELLKTIVEPSIVFGNSTDFSYPANFTDSFTVPAVQPDAGYTPCAFSFQDAVLSGGKTETVYTLIGNAKKYERLEQYAEEALTPDYISSKIAENKKLIDSIKSCAFTASSSRELNLYSGQTFLDNVLRGGYPLQLGRHCFYVYSRKHGDLEREYNFFQVDSTYYSQGNSNFRDVNQNRRNDVFFFPFTEETNIRTFFDLIQLDGFNPLVLKGARFRFPDTLEARSSVKSILAEENCEAMLKFLKRPFTPGDLFDFLEQSGIENSECSADDLFGRILDACEKEELAQFSDGYWVDHWTYNTDLLEQFLEMFPDKSESLFFGEKVYSFYDSDEEVLPRDRKYVLTASGVRQFHAVKKVEKKRQMIAERKSSPFKVRTNGGTGEIYFCTLAAKIVVLLVNKIASLDPKGVGVEMESDKPGWCDALNGLPGILGSAVNESAEIGRLASLFFSALNHYAPENGIAVPEEAACLYSEVERLLLESIGDFDYWNRACAAKEDYREKTRFGITGKETSIEIDDLRQFLSAIIAKVNRGVSKAMDTQTGVYSTYFVNEVTRYEILRDENGNPVKDDSGLPFVRALEFRQRPLPAFLEGPVHVMRMAKSKELACSLDRAVRKTGLYDFKLDMYKICDNVMQETGEIGRQNVFPRGWLENESVFLHMEYKYFLELLRCGAYEEFFRCIRTALVPFLNPEVYGRSILENSSFIASTVYPNEKLRGNGFVSRLTGASAEFLHMWRIMTVGETPFFLNQKGELNLSFQPVLPCWLFLKKETEFEIPNAKKTGALTLPPNTFAFRLFGRTLTVYDNEFRKDTFGENAAAVCRIELQRSGAAETFEGNVLPAPYAERARAGEFERINVTLC